MSISVFWLTFATCMVKARTFLTCQSFLGSTPNLLPVWLHFWVQARHWQGEHRRLHALVFISLSKITIITKLIMARFYHMRGRYYPSKDTNICDPWRTQIFLQAIFGGVSPERCHDQSPPLSANVFKPRSLWFPPSQMCSLFAWLWEHLLHELRVCDSFEKVSVLESQKTCYKSKLLLEMFLYNHKTSHWPFQMWHKEHRADNAL